jgi:hypothetical protein
LLPGNANLLIGEFVGGGLFSPLAAQGIGVLGSALPRKNKESEAADEDKLRIAKWRFVVSSSLHP